MCPQNRFAHPQFIIFISTALLSAGLIYLRVISNDFAYSQNWASYPTIRNVIAMLLVGSAYLVICRFLHLRPPLTSTQLLMLCCLGALARMLFLGSTPIYEDDFYRYFFDGQLIKTGLNPYLYLPSQALSTVPPDGIELLGGDNTIQPPHPELVFLQEHPFIYRVAYGHISTIYPPITQLFFGISQWIAPFSIDGWRVILIAVELTNLALLVALLSHFNKPKSWVLIYWLNPLLITETINAAHMDVIILPFMLGSLLTLLKGRSISSAVLLGLSVGVKFWPVILAPLFIAYQIHQHRRLTKTTVTWALTFSVILGLVLSPQILSRLGENAGLVSYSQFWQTNSFLFYWLNTFTEYLWENDLIGLSEPNLLPRVIVAAILLFFIGWLSLSTKQSQTQLLKNCLWAIGLLFFLSPTGYPWYFIWILPFLVLNPNFSLLLLTPLLALYDLRYTYQQHNNDAFFQYVFVTLEFLPSLLLLTYQFLSKTKKDKL